jgi:hypothetical protein
VSVIDDHVPGKPYVFSFAFGNTIDHNQPARETTGYTLIEATDAVTSSEYCSQAEYPATIYTVSNVSGEPAKGINLTFTCGRFTCAMGHTDWLGFGAAAGLTKAFPRCTNGIILGSGAGFLPGEKFITIDRDDIAEFLPLVPSIVVSVKVLKHPQFTPSQEELLSGSERAIISLSVPGTGFQSSTFFTQDPSDTEPPLQMLDEKTATYKVSLRLVRGEDVVGGYEGDWIVDASNIGAAKTAVFHAIESQHANEADNAAFLQNLVTHSTNVPKPHLT